MSEQIFITVEKRFHNLFHCTNIWF